MKGFTRGDLLFSLCGLNCGLCPMHLDGYCPGCGGGEGNQSCRIARCSLEHGGVAYCFQCGSFPCERYAGEEEFDSFITHRNRLADMEKAARLGPEAYGREQREKAALLEQLLAQYNDGRRKSFFCLAVNLLEAEEIQRGLEEAPLELPLKERSARLCAALRRMAEERGVTLQLRRKKSGKNSS